MQQQGRVMVHPFDDPFVVAGQGTVGVEILEGLPGATRIYVSIGGGGFIGGIAMAIRTIKPEAKIIGVETHGADAMAQSLAAGELVELPAITSIARTLGAPKVSDFTFRLVRELVEEVIVVDDAAACLPARSAATGRASGRVDFGMAPRHQRRARPPGVAGRLFPSGCALSGSRSAKLGQTCHNIQKYSHNDADGRYPLDSVSGRDINIGCRAIQRPDTVSLRGCT
jgi:hypothetical protein